MNFSKSLPEKEWGDLNSDAFFGRHDGSERSDLYVVEILEEYHALFESNVKELARRKKCMERIISEIASELKPLKLKDYTDEIKLKIGNEVLARMKKKFKSRVKRQTLPSGLSGALIEAIVNNKPGFIRNLAKAVTRIHGDGKKGRGRVQGHGSTFEVKPYDPAIVHALETVRGCTMPISKNVFMASVWESKGVRISKKKAQRVLRKVGASTDRGGRPRKSLVKDPHQAKPKTRLE